MEVQPLLDAIAAARQRRIRSAPSPRPALVAMADPAGLEQALAHLVQNAIDASEPDVPVVLRAFESGGDVAIEVVDRGAGMSAEFVRTRLFQPFASTKEQGFGVGAFEAKRADRRHGRPARGREPRSATAPASPCSCPAPRAGPTSIRTETRMNACT